MKTGRPPAWILDPEFPSAVFQDARTVDSRGRFTIPARLLAGLPGVDASSGRFLLVLDEPGRLELLPWVPYGDVAVQRRRTFLAADAEAAGTPATLRAMDDRYRRIRVEAGRIELPLPVVAHLDSRFRVHGVHLVRYPERLEIWSARYRNRRLGDVEWHPTDES